MLARRSMRLALATVLMISTVTASPAITKPRQADIFKTKRASNVIVLAHRACFETAPENSIAAIAACQIMGADAVEIDVRRAKDGGLVIMHDETVDRTTNGKGAVTDLTTAQIRGLRLRASAGGPVAPLTDQNVPTLEEALKSARGNLLVNVHFKAPVQAEVARLVKRLNMVGQVTTWVVAKPDDPMLLNSPLRGAVGIIPTLHQCAPNYPEPCWSLPIGSLKPYAQVRPVAFFVDWRQSNAFINAVNRAKRPTGARIFAETMNRIDNLPADARNAEWGALLDMGVSIIMTDQPSALIDYLKTVDQRGVRRSPTQRPKSSLE